MTNGKRVLSQGSNSYKLQNSLPWDVLDAERLHEFRKQMKEDSVEGHCLQEASLLLPKSLKMLSSFCCSIDICC